MLFFQLNLLCSYILIENRVRVKSSQMARGLANARPPGSAKFANALPPGLTRRANAPQLPGGGSWAQVELHALLYLETYSRRENVQFFGIDKVVPASEVDSPTEDTRDLVFKFLENKLRIENPRSRIEFQRVHRLGKPNNSNDKPRPIIARFLRYSDKEMVMDQARKELKRQEDKQFSVFDDIPKELYEIRKSQMKKFKEAGGKGCTVYFSKAQSDKLFVNGKFIPANAPLTDFV